MPSRTETTTAKFINDITYCFNNPLKRYIVVYDENSDIIEATNMTFNDYGVFFEEAVIRGKGGVRIGVGRVFIAHSVLVGVTLVEEEFGGTVIDNDTQLGLFAVINDG